MTVIGAADIQASAPANIADFVNQLPQVSGSVTPANSQRSLSAGTIGVNTINLRNLGSSRTLVLLDGHRSVGSVATGTVDVNTIPQGLVKSVEVVTGGASSVYGSDAVAGVVNFILDRKFTGLKGEVNYGETQYDDDKTFRATLTGGFNFAGGRGHVMVSGQYTDRKGVVEGVPRDWAANGMHLIQNPAYTPTNGLPELIATTRSGLNTTTGGGIITSGPLKGTYFGPGGVINHYNYGENYNTTTNSPWTVGGDWQQSQQYYATSLQPAEKFWGVFGRASYDLFDNFNVFTEVSYNKANSLNWGGYGTDKANVVIQADNAFIPASIKSQMAALGLKSFTMGTWNADQPARISDIDRKVQRYLGGFETSFPLLGTDWKADGYYQIGITDAHETVLSAQRQKLTYAQDAVFNSAGQIVCRVTLQGSTDPLAQGCVPYNRLGTGVTSQDAINYVFGVPYRDERFKQQVGALNFSTNIHNPWLKPIGIAFGAEHRKELISGAVPVQYQSGWISGNFLPTVGSYNVTEEYFEVRVPLPWKFDFDGAVRHTDYSASGNVVTWKAGLVWEPVSDLRLRVTRSRDIRAPNLSELYAAGTRNTNSVSDPWQTGKPAVRYTQTVAGNLALKPEKADTWGFGGVYRPHFLPGFGLSVDYYDIKIKGAIGTLGPQQIVDRCHDGSVDLCSRLVATVNGVNVPFGSGGFTQASGPGTGVTEYLIANSPYNFLVDRSRGIDFEASYLFNLADVIPGAAGKITFRGLATRYLEASESNGVDKPTDSVGENAGSGPPKWTYRATIGYDSDKITAQLVGRGLSAGVYSNQYVECQTGCPATNSINRTIYSNHIDGAFYLDTYFAYKIPVHGGATELYFRIANLLNKDPAKVGKGPSDNSNVDVGINQTLYDFLGRRFTVGARFAF
ncbi:TonB-dependent receptor domain-containing protein [Sphingomonas sp. MMS24-J13]|uniref:TonB-dependent receptor domain-containing protein n=1 Tax=Sphingomonas sp. MMS24-J13 TaxID=3238686 RepID=UPI003851675E